MKGEVNKEISPKAGLFLLRSPLDRTRSVLTCRAMISVAGHCGPVVGVFFCQRFSSLVRNKACQFRNQQAERWFKWQPWFYLGLVAHSFFWSSERASGRQ